jgi:hypothetical protein
VSVAAVTAISPAAVNRARSVKRFAPQPKLLEFSNMKFIQLEKNLVVGFYFFTGTPIASVIAV